MRKRATGATSAGMCGRYTYKLSWEEIVRLYRLTLPDEPPEKLKPGIPAGLLGSPGGPRVPPPKPHNQVHLREQPAVLTLTLEPLSLEPALPTRAVGARFQRRPNPAGVGVF